MYEMNCETCGRELFIGKILETSYEYWCPFCYGLNPLDRDEEIEVCENYIKEIRVKALTIAQTFSISALLFASLTSRELEARKIGKMENNNIRIILWSTLVIRDCIKGNYSTSSSKQPTAENLYGLFSYYARIIQSENLLVEVKEGYSHLFDSNSIAKSDFIHETVETEDKLYMAFPTQQKRYYYEMMQTLQMYPDERFELSKNIENAKAEKYSKEKTETKIRIGRAKRKEKEKLEKKLSNIEKASLAKIYEIIYNSFHSVCYNKDFFSFEDIGKDAKTIDFATLIREESDHEIKRISRQSGEEQVVDVIEISKFKNRCELNGVDFTDIRRILISSEDNCKEFPLLVERENNILVCPEMLLFILTLIKFGIDKESYKSDSSLLGNDFEKEVKAIFELHDFSLRHPLHKRQELINQKIKFEKDGELVEREVDLILYNEKLLFVVECKRNSFKPGYIFKSERQNRVSKNGGLKDEIDNKHIDRVTYLQENQRSLGFKGYREVKGLIVTLIKEDIECYKGMDIVPLCDLKMYLQSVQI
jgi:hypothetical protein